MTTEYDPEEIKNQLQSVFLPADFVLTVTRQSPTIAWCTIKSTADELKTEPKAETNPNTKQTYCLMFALYFSPSVYIYLSQLHKCGPHSGKQLLILLDQFAHVVHAERIDLVEDPHIEIEQGKCDIDYTLFLKLSTGYSYYNQFGYVPKDTQAPSGDDANDIEKVTKAKEKADTYTDNIEYDRAFIELPFTEAMMQVSANPKKSIRGTTEKIVIIGTDIPDYMRTRVPELGRMTYESNSVKDIFGAIKASNIVQTFIRCDDRAVIWIQAVTGYLGGEFRAITKGRMSKRVDVPEAKGGWKGKIKEIKGKGRPAHTNRRRNKKRIPRGKTTKRQLFHQ